MKRAQAAVGRAQLAVLTQRGAEVVAQLRDVVRVAARLGFLQPAAGVRAAVVHVIAVEVGA